jgi:lipopolysaccharide biosynthesis glycosyltransferase
MLAALIKSIEVNHSSESEIELFIVDDHIDEYNKAKIINSHSSAGITLQWLPIATVVPKNLNLPFDTSTFPLNVYIRVLISHFIPDYCKKAIYLDVDMIVRKDLLPLWDTDLQDRIIAGVVDRSEKVSSTWGGIPNYEELALNPESKYFNSGLLLIDVVQWRKTDLSAKILACIAYNKQHAFFPDQYGLNVVFADQWYELDQCWNTISESENPDPSIIHFIGIKPIYKTYKNNPFYKAEFFRYLEMTAWKGYKPTAGYNQFLNKLSKKLQKLVKSLVKI